MHSRLVLVRNQPNTGLGIVPVITRNGVSATVTEQNRSCQNSARILVTYGWDSSRIPDVARTRPEPHAIDNYKHNTGQLDPQGATALSSASYREGGGAYTY